MRERVHLLHHQRGLVLNCPQVVGTAADVAQLASEKCQQEKRKTVNGEDILFAMTSLGFENYSEALKIYLSRYREVSLTLLSLSVPVTVSFVAVTLAKTFI
jgi:hypothetical protein